MNQPLVPARYLKSAPGVAIARVTLGLTLYLDDGAFWAQGAAASALRSYLRYVPSNRLSYFTTSRVAVWNRIYGHTIDTLIQMLGMPLFQTRARHLLSVQIVDDVYTPETGFSYREVDTRLSPMVGHLQMTFPQDHDPADLLNLANELANLAPFCSGVGGYLATWNPWKKGPAFHDQHRWAKRYLGLDLQDPDAMAWRARSGLAGANWLTMFAHSLADKLRIDVPALKLYPWKHDIEINSFQRGVVVKAGERPTLGDVNQLQFPLAYADVARQLQPFLVPTRPDFHGAFWGNDDTLKWSRRLFEPQGWI